MTHLDDFIQREGSFRQVSEAATWARSKDLKKRKAHRDLAANINDNYSLGYVQLDDTTPQPAVDGVYTAGIAVTSDIASGFFHDEKQRIISEAPDSKLGKDEVVLGIHYTKTGNKKHDNAVDAASKYRGIHDLNQAYDTRKPLDGRRIGRNDLIGLSIPFVKDKVRERFDIKTNSDNKYVSAKTKKLVESAVIGVLVTTNGAPRVTSSLIEKDAKVRYETILSDKAEKAYFVRTNLRVDPKEDRARQELYQIMTQAKAA